ncbi:CHAP domain-containing protein [Staphylococcus devriesei]|uniref:CHAP domain-containing protein n=1 Tax=Staphylococcus devriesei TaxID=586733 RepID=UPI000E68663B|nr:CHAP domain-containing protein [Staphylococcus devriesei]RIL72447.1 CHAP domain-containing protein [Staphylococcus devriesei]
MRNKTLTVTLASIASFVGFNGLAHAQQTHVVKDTISVQELAHQFATTTSEIRSLNNITTNQIQSNTQVILPDNDIIEVKPGDTLNKIASAHHLTLNQLYALNPGLTLLIHPGDLIAVSEKGAASLDSSLVNYGATYTVPATDKQGEKSVKDDTVAKNVMINVDEHGEGAQLATSDVHKINVVQAPVDNSFNKQNVTHTSVTSSESSAPKPPSVSRTSAVSHVYHASTTSKAAHLTPSRPPMSHSTHTVSKQYKVSRNTPVSHSYSYRSIKNQGNQYYYGNCTYYAFNRRQQLGRSVGSYWGNANNWAHSARHAGLVVDHRAEVGAVFQTNAGYYGHVGVVERVNRDGSVYVSEMNWNGHFNHVTNRTIRNTAGYNFIH